MPKAGTRRKGDLGKVRSELRLRLEALVPVRSVPVPVPVRVWR
jgi:hypothetical protein